MIDELIALGLLTLSAVAGGMAAKKFGLPPLLGMLLAGLALRNTPGGLIESLPNSWSVTLRLTALTIILLRAGLGLDLDALRRLRAPFLRLAFLPNFAEASAVALAAWVLLDLPLLWGVLLGFVIAAVSPAVVVPSLLDLQSQGYGTKKGIPTMVLAAASFDDVLSITGFGISVSLIFGGQAESGFAATLLRAPLELLLGIGGGVLAGWTCVVLARSLPWLRLLLLAGAGLLAIFAGWAVGFAGAGSLAVMTMGAVVARAWGPSTKQIAALMGHAWKVAQPILFGLIGAAVLLSVVEPSYIGLGLLILTLGLAVRLVVSYLSVGGKEFTHSERLFVALAWIPKATVQAAIGALALDLANEYGAGEQAVEYGMQVLTIAVLAIVVSAPIGALAIAWSGPRWLEKDPPTNQPHSH